MSTNEKIQESQEIDLALLSKKISGVFKSINRSIFLIIQFFIKHILLLGILILVGLGIGIYLDINQKVYNNEIIVRPNFESTDYVYSKIELLKSKIKDRDTVFLKSIGIQNPSKISNIQIAPIIDIYKFISTTSSKDNDQNFQILKLLAESSDIKTIVSEKTTSKNYAFHKISFSTKSLTSRKEIIDPLLKYLQDNEYYTKIKNEYIQNNNTKIEQSKVIIEQIDGLLNNFSKESNGNLKSDKLIYYNENTQLSDIIQTKRELISEISRIKLDNQTTDKIVKENSTTINILNTKSINGKLKFVLPILFVSIYFMIFLFINFYKKQSSIYSKEQI
ncbi:hypothetical protein [Flavobacterium sp.]|uniref:hypothetical protein n=1 Tax=Flavobacterium sp. TaxID=239 RepID=UPI00286B4C70|nr:hypothetical protein [Flavobacterium sp.]